MNKKFPIAVLDEHPDWLNPLYEEFKKREIEYIKIDISSASYDPQSTDVYPFYINRLSPSAAKRKHQSAFPYALNYIKYLEGLGVRIINGSHSVLLETSKALQSALLRKLKIPQPKTIILNDLLQIERYINHFSFPVVVKPNRGGSGMDIQKFNTPEELRFALANSKITLPVDDLLLLQEFIQPKDGHIVRVETIGKKVVYAMKVFTKGTFNLCPSDSCDIQREDATVNDIGYCVATPTEDVKFELYRDIPDEIVKAVVKIVTEANLECAGIEYMVGQDEQWYIYDINALSILRSSFKEEYGIDAWSLLADYFVEEYKKQA
ncbi:MAG: hypothetical protein KGJ07_07720 [Patescibacteria group bacterium]|nr:hypothetical protein [Patescibacteria group bacterium]